MDHSYIPYELVFDNLVNFQQSLVDKIKINPVCNHDDYYRELKLKLQYTANKAIELVIISSQKRITNKQTKFYNIDILGNLNVRYSSHKIFSRKHS